MKEKIRVMWIVNTIFPFPAKRIGIQKNNFGGWMKALMDDILKNKKIELAVATVYNGKKLLEMFDSETGIYYYLIPGKLNRKYSVNAIKYWKTINDSFKPNIVHINGTEYSMGIEFQNACPDVRTVVSIQGLLLPYGREFYAQIPFWDRLKNITIIDIIKRRTIFNQKHSFLKGAKNEELSIKKAKAITGRTTWDYSYTKAINSQAKYYYCARTLRKNFYESDKWCIDNIDKHTIFCSQGNYPIKGMHFMIKALEIVRKDYPDVKLFVAGHNIMKKKDNKDRIKYTGYAKYIRNLIKKYNLEKNVEFLGVLDEEEMINSLLKSNVYVQPSAAENSPNSLGEAMILGLPCIASCVGGTSDMLTHQKDGYLYTYTDYPVLAEYIKQIFTDKNKCIEFSKNAILRASNTHNREENYNNTVEMYMDMMKEVYNEK